VLTTAIGRSMSTLDNETQARMRRKFKLCFVMAKESIPFAKYPALIQLEERHGVDLSHAYRTPLNYMYVLPTFVYVRPNFFLF